MFMGQYGRPNLALAGLLVMLALLHRLISCSECFDFPSVRLTLCSKHVEYLRLGRLIGMSVSDCFLQ